MHTVRNEEPAARHRQLILLDLYDTLESKLQSSILFFYMRN